MNFGLVVAVAAAAAAVDAEVDVAAASVKATTGDAEVTATPAEDDGMRDWSACKSENRLVSIIDT